jgi:hypothetical protein
VPDCLGLLMEVFVVSLVMRIGIERFTWVLRFLIADMLQRVDKERALGTFVVSKISGLLYDGWLVHLCPLDFWVGGCMCRETVFHLGRCCVNLPRCRIFS